MMRSSARAWTLSAASAAIARIAQIAQIDLIATIAVSSIIALVAAPALGDERRAGAWQLAWLAGCWAYAGADAGSGETWMPPAGGQLLGVARRIEGGRVASYEFQRIAEDDSSLAYFASLAGQPEVRFALQSLSSHEVVFANPDNHYPQRVIYRLTQTGDIAARIEGASDDPARGVDFPMKRTSCEQAGKR
jgi:hypothetical protein